MKLVLFCKRLVIDFYNVQIQVQSENACFHGK